MTIKLRLSVLLLTVVSCFSCKKSTTTTTNTTSVSTIANIDSITGFYAGTTSGDSIYTNANGNQVIYSFSWPDTLQVTSPDTANIIATSKYYTINYSYSYNLTATDSITVLQNYTLGDNGYIAYNTVLLDTANSVNHIIINTWYSYTKHTVTNVTLYKRH